MIRKEFMDRKARIYVAGHKGLVGTALVRRLQSAGYGNLILRSHGELDLTDASQVARFFREERPDYVFVAAAKVGGIVANNSFPAEFIHQNLAIELNLIDSAHRFEAQRLLFLGSSCIYPRLAPQPIKEEYLLSRALELTNRPYAVAKIAGIEMCWSYNRQYGTRFLAAMPTNLYGPGDNYDLTSSHVIPAIIRKMHAAKVNGDRAVTLWGTGTPRREFLYSDDLADACVFLMNLDEQQFGVLITSDTTPPLINIGSGEDLTIRELAELLSETVEFEGEIVFDDTKPDGTPRKLLDVSRMKSLGWQYRTDMPEGLVVTYADYVSRIGGSGPPRSGGPVDASTGKGREVNHKSLRIMS